MLQQPDDTFLVARVADWLETLTSPAAALPSPVEEHWETCSVVSSSANGELYAPRVVFPSHMAEAAARRALPVDLPGKQTKAVHFAPTASESGSSPLSLRLRRRGRLTNALEQAVKQSIGRWSDLPGGAKSAAHVWLSGYGAGMLPKMTEGSVIIGDKEDVETGKVKRNTVSTVWVPFATGNGTGNVRALLVAPALVAELSSRRIFRSVTSVLMGSLRGRARVWADELGVSAMDLCRILPGSLALAMLPTLDEAAALSSLRGSAGRWSVEVLGALERGVLRAPPAAPLGNFLRGPLSWFFRKEDHRVLAPGVDTLNLSA